MHICNREEIPIDHVFFICFGLYAMIVSSYKILKILSLMSELVILKFYRNLQFYMFCYDTPTR